MFSKETLCMAFLVALLPPIWAVAAPHLNINTGAVALITAGLYVTNGNKLEDALKITIGFLLGDFWSWIVINATNILQLNPEVELFSLLFVLGGLAVLISSIFPKWIFCPAWLAGWAIGLTIMSTLDISEVNSYFVQIGIAMAVGIWYVGAFLYALQVRLMRLFKK